MKNLPDKLVAGFALLFGAAVGIFNVAAVLYEPLPTCREWLWFLYKGCY